MHLQIERDTFGMLQCHPYTTEYVENSKQCPHYAFLWVYSGNKGFQYRKVSNLIYVVPWMNLGWYVYVLETINGYLCFICFTNKIGKTSTPRGRESSPKSCNMLCLVNNGYSICYV